VGSKCMGGWVKTGYSFAAGQEVLRSGVYFGTIGSAESAVLAAHGPRTSYLLWHSPQQVIQRCQTYICNGTGYLARQEKVIDSSLARLEYMSHMRHRIAHDNKDTKAKFNGATLGLVGRIYRGSRPGRFLRDVDLSTPTRGKWLETLANELVGLASQMI
jgi:hypothetical protein